MGSSLYANNDEFDIYPTHKIETTDDSHQFGLVQKSTDWGTKDGFFPIRHEINLEKRLFKGQRENDIKRCILISMDGEFHLAATIAPWNKTVNLRRGENPILVIISLKTLEIVFSQRLPCNALDSLYHLLYNERYDCLFLSHSHEEDHGRYGGGRKLLRFDLSKKAFDQKFPEVLVIGRSEINLINTRDERFLAFINPNERNFRVLDLETGESELFDTNISGAERKRCVMEYDENTLIFGGVHKTNVIDIVEKKIISSLPTTNYVYSLGLMKRKEVVDQNEYFLISGTINGTIEVWSDFLHNGVTLVKRIRLAYRRIFSCHVAFNDFCFIWPQFRPVCLANLKFDKKKYEVIFNEKFENEQPPVTDYTSGNDQNDEGMELKRTNYFSMHPSTTTTTKDQNASNFSNFFLVFVKGRNKVHVRSVLNKQNEQAFQDEKERIEYLMDQLASHDEDDEEGNVFSGKDINIVFNISFFSKSTKSKDSYNVLKILL